jgi:hypothetical protein
LGCRGDVGGDDSWADPSDSLRDLIFPLAFEPLDGDAFILQEQGVFTRIRSGAAPVAGGGGARGFSLPCVAAEATVERNSIGSIRVTATGKNEKP